MTRQNWKLLFNDFDLSRVLDHKLRAVNDSVIAIPTPRFQSESDEFLAASVASRLVLEPLEILEVEISVSQRDVKVDVSQRFDRVVMDRSRPTYVDGIEVTYHVPFTGAAELLRCQPSTFTLNPPHAVLSNGELHFPFEQPGRDVSATQKEFQDALQRVREWLPWVNGQVAEYNASLEAQVRNRIIQRRSELLTTAEELNSLGYKIRTSGEQATTTPAIEQPSRKTSRGARKTKKRHYDVALSFAGEDREYVERVAEALRVADVSVFYDAFEQVQLWGKDLATHLGTVYSKDSRFVVMFLSRFYAAKAWPKHEKQFALGRALGGDEGRILPVRFDNTEVPGVPPTIGFLDLRVLTPEKLAELIRQKLTEEGDS